MINLQGKNESAGGCLSGKYVKLSDTISTHTHTTRREKYGGRRSLPRANYKPACVVYIIIIICFLFLFLFSSLGCACDYLGLLLTSHDAFSLALRIRRVCQRPLNAFINASPWPNSQHLCVVVSFVGVVIYMHTSFCIHDVLLPLHSSELTELMLPEFHTLPIPHCVVARMSVRKNKGNSDSGSRAQQ